MSEGWDEYQKLKILHKRMRVTTWLRLRIGEMHSSDLMNHRVIISPSMGQHLLMNAIQSLKYIKICKNIRVHIMYQEEETMAIKI